LKRAAGCPEQLRAAGATDLERRLLNAVAEERPSPELQERMARSIGIPTAALGASAAATKLGAGAAASKAAWGSSSLLLWIAAGVASVTVASIFVATRVFTSPPSPARGASPVVSAPAPPASSAPPAASDVAPAAVEPSPGAGAPVPTPHGRPGTKPNDLGDQIALVDAARAALSAGAADRALELLRQYQTKYPAGSFRPEAAALRIEALAKLGRGAEARALAERFVAEHAGSPLADRVARITGLTTR
jgi:hypothetical protein